jgi:hypothetical protein
VEVGAVSILTLREALAAEINRCNAAPEVRTYRSIHELELGEYLIHEVTEQTAQHSSRVYYTAEIEDGEGNLFSMFMPPNYRSTIGAKYVGVMQPPLRCLITPNIARRKGTILLLD